MQVTVFSFGKSILYLQKSGIYTIFIRKMTRSGYKQTNRCMPLMEPTPILLRNRTYTMPLKHTPLPQRKISLSAQ